MYANASSEVYWKSTTLLSILGIKHELQISDLRSIYTYSAVLVSQ